MGYKERGLWDEWVPRGRGRWGCGVVPWGTVVCEAGGYVWGWLWVPGGHGHGAGQEESPCVPHKVSVGPGTADALGWVVWMPWVRAVGAPGCCSHLPQSECPLWPSVKLWGGRGGCGALWVEWWVAGCHAVPPTHLNSPHP